MSRAICAPNKPCLFLGCLVLRATKGPIVMQFAYTAKSTAGDVLSGMMNADSMEHVRNRLRDQDLFPMSVTKRSFLKDLFATKMSKPKGRVKPRELLNMTTQLAIMTKAGIDLAGALKTLSDQTTDKTLKKTLAEVYEDVTGGKAVSASLQKHVHIFGDAYIASVAAGEASGRLSEVFNRLAQLQRSDLRSRQAITTLMAYPILLSSVSFLVILGLVGFVLPQFAEIFSQYEIDLPRITVLLIAISTELRSRLWLWGPLFGTLGAVLVLSRKTAAGKKMWDRALLNTRIIRNVTQSVLIGRMFRLLGLMIDSGVPLLEGLRLTKASIKNSLYQDLFVQLEDDILNGRGLANALVQAGFVPTAAAEMVLTAEKTGTLGMVTQLMGEHYEEEGEAKLRELATIAEPLIIVVMGAVVAMVVLSVMLPMFELSTLAR